MKTHQIHVSKGHDRMEGIRNELFAFSEVLEVFAFGRPDVLVVVCSGHPRPAQWLRALRTAGYEVAGRRRSGAVAGVSAERRPRRAVGVDAIERLSRKEGGREAVEVFATRRE